MKKKLSILSLLVLLQSCAGIELALKTGEVGARVAYFAMEAGFKATAVAGTIAGGGAICERVSDGSGTFGIPYYSFRKHASGHGRIENLRYISYPGDLIVGTVLLPVDLIATPSDELANGDYPKYPKSDDDSQSYNAPDPIIGHWSWKYPGVYLTFDSEGEIFTSSMPATAPANLRCA